MSEIDLINEWRKALAESLEVSRYDRCIEEHSKIEVKFNRFNELTLKFLGCSRCLDPYLEYAIRSLGLSLLDIFDHYSDNYFICIENGLVNCLYAIIRVKGWRCSSLLPNDMSLFSLIYKKLTNTSSSEEIWRKKLILQFWLAELFMLPFPLQLLAGESVNSIVEKLFLISHHSICSVGLECFSASLCIGRLAARPESAELVIKAILRNLKLSLNSSEINMMIGYLSVLNQVFKYGRSEYLILNITEIFDVISDFLHYDHNSVLQKVIAKQFLKLTSFLLSIKRNTGQSVTQHSKIAIRKLTNEKAVGMIEKTIDYLLNMLICQSTENRIYAAKAISKIFTDLDLIYRDQLIRIIFDLFRCDIIVHWTNGEKNFSSISSSNWHGACFLTAELIKRSLIPTKYLDSIIEFCLMAMKLDRPILHRYLDESVRDAACYLIWCLNRFYETSPEFLIQISNSLVTTFLFDVSINVRRAANAAFQEGVGRQGDYPNGLEILKVADFYTISRLEKTYDELSVIIFEFPSYSSAIINNLMERRLFHYEKRIRESAGRALAKLIANNGKYAFELIPRLIESINSEIVTRSSSSMMTISNLLEICAEKSDLTLTSQVLKKIKTHMSDVNILLIKHTGTDEELKGRNATIPFNCFLKSYLSSYPDADIDLILLKRYLCNLVRDITEDFDSKTLALYRLYISRYLKKNNGYLDLNKFSQSESVEHYCDLLSILSLDWDQYSSLRKGCLKLFKTVIASHSSKKNYKHLYRKFTIMTVLKILSNVGHNLRSNIPESNSKFQIELVILYECFEIIQIGMADNEKTSQGDVGSHIRIIAYEGSAIAISYIALFDYSGVSKASDCLFKLVCGCLEAIDRMRYVSWRSLHKLMLQDVRIFDFMPEGEFKANLRRGYVPQLENLLESSYALLEDLNRAYLLEAYAKLISKSSHVQVLSYNSISSYFAENAVSTSNKEKVLNSFACFLEVKHNSLELEIKHTELISLMIEAGYFNSQESLWHIRIYNYCLRLLLDYNNNVSLSRIVIKIYAYLALSSTEIVKKRAIQKINVYKNLSNTKLSGTAKEWLEFVHACKAKKLNITSQAAGEWNVQTYEKSSLIIENSVS